jgi:acyl-CoA reductase-like NAD-dependent aldehyde dehydrogenase
MRKNYIGGGWTPSASDRSIDVVNPATEAVIDQVPAGHPADVDQAVHAARNALPGWSATSAAERARFLAAAADLLEARSTSVAAAITADRLTDHIRAPRAGRHPAGRAAQLRRAAR